MARYIELDTDVEVDVCVLPPYRGTELCAEVVFPNGRRYGCPQREIEKHFRIVTPQLIEMGATFGLEYER